jgi:hypothetical protein
MSHVIASIKEEDDEDCSEIEFCPAKNSQPLKYESLTNGSARYRSKVGGY